MAKKKPQLTSYTKSKPDQNSTDSVKGKSRFGVTLKSVLTVMALTAFFVVVMLGVLIAQRQRQSQEVSAPTAPKSQPSASSNQGVCTKTVTIAGPSVSPTVSPSASPTVSPSASPTATTTPSVSPTEGPSATPTTPAGDTSYSCDSSCETDSQCQTANADYTCSAEAGNKCRLDSNRGSTTCQAPANSYACNSTCQTNEQCQSANSNYICQNNQCRLGSNPSATNCQPAVIVTPTPALGCNEVCTTNADCSNSSYICFATKGGNRCRLDNYPNSDTCTPVGISSPSPTSAIATVPDGQPDLPAELPVAGPENWANWLKAGLVTLGVGAALLLLL